MIDEFQAILLKMVTDDTVTPNIFHLHPLGMPNMCLEPRFVD